MAIAAGMLSLIFISYALYKVSLKTKFSCFIFNRKCDFYLKTFRLQCGFFKRDTRDNLVELKRQSDELRSYWVVPGDGVDDYEDGEATPLRSLRNQI